MKDIVITPEDQKIMEFFKKTVDKESMALYIRRSVYVMSKLALSHNDDDFNKVWLDFNFYKHTTCFRLMMF